MATLESDGFNLTHNLGFALVASSVAPLLLMKADRTVLAASTSFLSTFQVELDTVLGRPIEALGGGNGTSLNCCLC